MNSLRQTLRALGLVTMAAVVAGCASGPCEVCGYVKAGNERAVWEELERGQSPNRADERQSVPLVRALRRCNAKIAHLLLDRGADARAVAPDGRSALDLAAACGSSVVSESLMRGGAEVNRRGRRGWTPLMHAAADGDPQLIALLLAHQANAAEVSRDGWTSLQLLLDRRTHAGDRLQTSLALLLSARAQAGTGGAAAPAPLVLALRFGSREASAAPLVALLLDHGADPNTRDGFGMPALSLALQRADGAAVARLLDAGADPAELDGDGRPALSFACEGGLEQVRWLLAARPDLSVRFRTESDGGWLFDPACASDPAIAVALVDAGVPIDQSGKRGQTALHAAARYNYLSAASNLLSLGFDVNGGDRDEGSPLHWAASKDGSLQMVELLLAHGADPTVRARGLLPSRYTRDPVIRKRLDEATLRRNAVSAEVEALERRWAAGGRDTRGEFDLLLNRYKEDPGNRAVRRALVGLNARHAKLPPIPSGARAEEETARRIVAAASGRTALLAAAAHVEAAIALAPWYALYDRRLCNLYMLTGAAGRAAQHCDLYMGTRPPDAEALTAWIRNKSPTFRFVSEAAPAASSASEERPNAAGIAYYSRLIASGVNWPSARFDRGLAYYNEFQREPNTAASVADFDEALRLDPNFREAYRYRAYAVLREIAGEPALATTPRGEGALADLERLLGFSPSDAQARLQRAKLLAARGHHPEALADFSVAQLALPDDEEIGKAVFEETTAITTATRSVVVRNFIPRGFFTNDDYWLYVDGRLADAPPHGSFPSLKDESFAIFSNDRGIVGYDDTGKSFDIRDGRFEFLSKRLRALMFDVRVLTVPPGAHRINLVYHDDCWGTRQWDLIERVVDARPGGRIDLEFAVRWPECHAEAVPPINAGTSAEYIRETRENLRAAEKRYAADPLVQAFQNSVPPAPCAERRPHCVLIQFSGSKGGPREIDARLYHRLVLDLRRHRSVEATSGADLLKLGTSSERSEARALDLEIEAFNARVGRFPVLDAIYGLPDAETLENADW